MSDVIEPHSAQVNVSLGLLLVKAYTCMGENFQDYSLFILMDFLTHIDTISMELSFLQSKGLPMHRSKFI